MTEVYSYLAETDFFTREITSLNTDHLDMDDALLFCTKAMRASSTGRSTRALALSMVAYAIMRDYQGRAKVQIIPDNVVQEMPRNRNPRRAVADLISGIARYIVHEEQGDCDRCCEEDVANAMSKYLTWVVCSQDPKVIRDARVDAVSELEDFDA